MEGKYNSPITENSTWKKVIRSVINNMFKIDIDTDRIYIDLNSCISILFRYENINDEEVSQDLINIIEDFLSRYINKGSQIVILWTLERSSVHTSIFPDWCKKRSERVDISKSNIIKTLIVTLNEFSKNNTKQLKIINTKDVHPAILVRHFELINKKRNSIVLSKDVVFQCLNMTNVMIFTGVNFIDFNDSYRPLPNDIELEDPDTMLKYYLAIKGDIHNEFPGVEGYGIKRSLDYIKFHKLEILAGCEHSPRSKEKILKDHIDKYYILFDVNELSKLNTTNIEELIKSK